VNNDTFYFGPGINREMTTFRDSTTSEKPFRDLLIQLWERSWCGLDKVGLSWIKIAPYILHAEPGENLLIFHFQEDNISISESEAPTVDSILRLIAIKSASDKKGAEHTLREVQAQVTTFDRIYSQALYQMVMREVEWRVDLLPNRLAHAGIVTYGELVILYESGDEKCYVVKNATSVLEAKALVQELRITAVPVDVSVVPQVQPVLNFLQDNTFEDLYQIRGMPVA
jgi:hypothetical protein